MLALTFCFAHSLSPFGRKFVLGHHSLPSMASRNTYVKVSDLNPGEPIPLDIGYGGYPPARSLYEASTWDVYGTSLPPYPSGSNGNVYVSHQGVGGAYGVQGSLRTTYGDPNNFGVTGPGLGYGHGIRPAEEDPRINPYPGFPDASLPMPSRKPQPTRREGFSPVSGGLAETPIDDPVYVAPPIVDTTKGFKLKNPLLVLGFLLAVYGAFQFFWSGIDGLVAAKGGGKISWQKYLAMSVMLFGLTLLASVLLDFSFLRLEELNG